MATPRAGVTHDIVVHVNDSQLVGLVVRPMSYRVSTVPKFAPQFTVGNVTAADKSWLRSFKFTFERGEGVQLVNDPSQTKQYAWGAMVTVSPEGAIMPSIVPVQTSSHNATPVLTSQGIKRFMFTMSGAPRLLEEASGLFAFTGYKWVASHTNQFGIDLTKPANSAVMHSGVAMMAFDQSGIIAYGKTGGNKAARAYIPMFGNSQPIAFNYSRVNLLYNYDKRLWKTLGCQIAHWDVAQSKWSSWVDVGEATTDVLASETFIGRKFFGKADGLWVFDAGRVYQVEDYATEAGERNFKLMVAYRGALYYNIGLRLFRYTAGGAIEQLPWSGGEIKKGNPGLGVLLIHAVDKTTGSDGLWSFSPDTGAFTQVLNSSYIQYKPEASAGIPTHWELFEFAPADDIPLLWLGPATVRGPTVAAQADARVVCFKSGDVLWDEQYENQAVSVSRGMTPPVVLTPAANLGTPGETKLLHRVKAYYKLYSPSTIKIYGKSGEIPKELQTLIFGGVDDAGVIYDESAAPGFIWTTINLDAYIVAGAGDVFTKWVVAGSWNPLHYWQPMEYYSATGWKTLPLTTEPAWKRDYVWRGAITAAWEAPSDWVPQVIAAYSATAAYYVRWQFQKSTDPPVIPDYAHFYGVWLAYVKSLTSGYTLLGTISDEAKTEAVIDVDPPLQGQLFCFLIEFLPAELRRPEVTALEIEYTTPESDKLQVGAMIVGTQPIQLLNRDVENSAAWIAATLFSVWQAGKPFPVQLPFPFPTAHTRNMVITLQPPGAAVPILAYEHSFVGAEYSIVLREI